MSCELEDSTTNRGNSSPMFLNCLLLDLTMTDLMHMVQMNKIGVKVAKKLRYGLPGGGVVTHYRQPRTRGEGSEMGKLMQTSFKQTSFKNVPLTVHYEFTTMVYDVKFIVNG